MTNKGDIFKHQGESAEKLAKVFPDSTSLEQVLIDKMLYIGEEIPESLVNDPRPKFIVLGTP